MKFSVILFIALLSMKLVAQEQDFSPIRSQAHVLEYPVEYFRQYQPSTALDMVQQIPGFQLDDGDNTRGFGAAAGNILINDRRLSAKQNLPSEILARLPAELVARIELIRGQVREINLQGQPAVVNIILQDDLPAVIYWNIFFIHNNHAPFKPGGNFSLSHQWNNIEYSTGLTVERFTTGERELIDEFDADGNLIKDSIRKRRSTGIRLIGTLNASTLFGVTLANFNSRFLYETRNPLSVKHVSPQIPENETYKEVVAEEQVSRQAEIGFDLEQPFGQHLAGKAIFLFYRSGVPKLSTREVFDIEGNQELSSIADRNTKSTEAVSRFELKWKRLENHLVQLNLEGAYNALEGQFLQIEDTGSGPQIIEIPGANSRVEEVRGDFLLKDIWSSERFELQYGIGAEISSISQSRNVDETEQTFFYLKPQLAVSYGQRRHLQLRLEREVLQLNFNDFISSVLFEDDRVSLGNPNLRPDRTWVSEIIYEHRYSRENVFKLTGFYHWVTDLVDLLPLSSTIEVAGNIGNGKRWGMELEGTVALEWLGLSGARLNIITRWQDSEVLDPITGRYRVFSGQGGHAGYRTLSDSNKNNRYFIKLDYRQDFTEAQVSWGWAIAKRDKRPLFRSNELDVYNEGFAVDAFIETTRWLSLKIGLTVHNLLDYGQYLDQTYYDGGRAGVITSSAINKRMNGRRTALTISGSF